MEQKETISIIVPVYNVEQYLVRCVQSILNQTYENLEVILVDDGSKDSSGAMCDTFTDSRVRVIHKENGGLSSARNAGIDIATGEYIGFVDSDDWIEPEMYETMLALAKKEQAKLVCAGRYDVDSATGKKTPGLCPEKTECITGEEFVGRIFRWQGCDSSAWDKLYHRSLLKDFRYPLGLLSEDVAITYKIALSTPKVALCARPFYNYYHRPQSITTAAVSEKTFHYPEHTRTIYAYIQEHHPALQKQARYLRVKALSYLLVTLDQASAEFRKTYAQQHRQARRELRGHLWFALSCPWLGLQEKVTDVLLILNLYRLLRPVFHRE